MTALDLVKRKANLSNIANISTTACLRGHGIFVNQWGERIVTAGKPLFFVNGPKSSLNQKRAFILASEHEHQTTANAKQEQKLNRNLNWEQLKKKL